MSNTFPDRNDKITALRAWYEFNKPDLILWSILFSFIWTTFLDFQFDFEIYSYLISSLILAFIGFKIIKSFFLKSLKKNFRFYMPNEISINEKNLEIFSYKKPIFCELKECRGFQIDNFVFIRTPRLVHKEEIYNNLIITVASQEILESIECLFQLTKKKAIITRYVTIFIILLLITTKGLNIFINYAKYPTANWEITQIEIKGMNLKVQIDNNDTPFQFRNNYTVPSTESNRKLVVAKFRHEIFNKINLIYLTRNYSSKSDRNNLDSLLHKHEIFGFYDFKYFNNELIISNEDYRMWCKRTN